jgi:transposase
MARGKAAVSIVLSVAEGEELESLVRRRSTGQATAIRARMILMAAEGARNTVIAERLGIGSQHTVGRWRRRFASGRIDGLFDEPRPGAPRTIGDDEIAETISRTLETSRCDALELAVHGQHGLAPSTIHRIWKAFGLQPHRTGTFKLSTGPLFVEKVRDIVGLYLKSARASGRMVWRREEPDPSARPHPPALAHRSGASGSAYP